MEDFNEVVRQVLVNGSATVVYYLNRDGKVEFKLLGQKLRPMTEEERQRAKEREEANREGNSL
jgi:hypothetical protein